MSIHIASSLNTIHSEDIAVGGAAIISQPCTVYSFTFTNDSDATATLSVADIGTYVVGSRVLKVRIAARGTEHLCFPRGMKFSTAVSVKPNRASTNVSVTYD